MAEPVHGPSASGSVVLDLGPCTGAVIVHAPPELDGREIQIRPCDPSAGPGTHSVVRARQTARGVQHAAVYPDLRPGDYIFWLDGGGGGELAVTVAAGRVTTARWR
jgi:hypothetical protein